MGANPNSGSFGAGNTSSGLTRCGVEGVEVANGGLNLPEAKVMAEIPGAVAFEASELTQDRRAALGGGKQQ